MKPPPPTHAAREAAASSASAAARRADPVPSPPALLDDSATGTADPGATDPTITQAGEAVLEGRLAEMSLLRQVAVLAVWPFFELLLNSLVGVVDTALAGRLNAVALDAIGVAAYIGWLIGMLHTSLGVGAGALISRKIGGRKRTQADAALGQALILALIWGAITAAVIAAGAPWIAAIFSLPEATHELAVTYLRVVAVGAAAGGVMVVGNACLRAAGDTRTPFLLMVLVNVVNAAMSLLFTFGPAPWGGWGVAGIAAGTAVAWFVGAALVVATLLRGGFRSVGKVPLRLRLRWLKLRWRLGRRIVRVGLPSLIESSGMWVGNAIIGGFVGILIARTATDGLMGAHIIGIRIESLSFLPGAAIGMAAATLMGQYLGAGRPDLAKRAVGLCWGIGVGIMSVMGVLFLLIPGWFAALLAPGEAMAGVREMAVPLLRICGPIQVFFGTYLILSQALRGAGDTRGPMMITYASTFLVRLPAAYLLALPLGFGLTGMWFGLCGELVVRGLLYVWRFRAGRWQTIKV